MPHRLILALLLLGGCYGKPELPDLPSRSAEPAPVDATRPRPTPRPQPARQEARERDLRAILSRLAEAPDRPAPQRDGAVSWRPPELEKVHELLIESCEAGPVPCAATARLIAGAALPRDEVWPLAGRFLNRLRPQAVAGLPPLLTPLLGSPDPEARDRAYRLLVGAELIHRGQPAKNGYAAATLPSQPAVGERTWLVVERIAPCGVGDGSFKGPDPTGRVDALITLRCDDLPPEPEAPGPKPLAPRVHRVVATLVVPAFPASGLEVHAPDLDAPLLRVHGRADDSKPEDDMGFSQETGGPDRVLP